MTQLTHLKGNFQINLNNFYLDGIIIGKKTTTPHPPPNIRVFISVEEWGDTVLNRSPPAPPHKHRVN